MIREAIILASGLSSRLKRAGIKVPKFALNVGGFPLISYPINSLLLAGIEHFTIVVAEKYYDYASNLIENNFSNIEVNLITNRHPELENGYSLILALKNISNKYALVSMADHIYPIEIPLNLIECFKHCSFIDILLGGDSSPMYVDLNEATRILADSEGKVVEVGKGISSFNFIDVGVMIVGKNVVDELALRDLNMYLPLSDLILAAVKYGLSVKICDVSGIPWTEMDTYTDYIELLYGMKNNLLKIVKTLWEEAKYGRSDNR